MKTHSRAFETVSVPSVGMDSIATASSVPIPVEAGEHGGISA